MFSCMHGVLWNERRVGAQARCQPDPTSHSTYGGKRQKNAFTKINWAFKETLPSLFSYFFASARVDVTRRQEWKKETEVARIPIKSFNVKSDGEKWVAKRKSILQNLVEIVVLGIEWKNSSSAQLKTWKIEKHKISLKLGIPGKHCTFVFIFSVWGRDSRFTFWFIQVNVEQFCVKISHVKSTHERSESVGVRREICESVSHSHFHFSCVHECATNNLGQWERNLEIPMTLTRFNCSVRLLCLPSTLTTQITEWKCYNMK